MLRILQFECQRFVYNLRQIASAMVQIVREIGECTFVVIFFSSIAAAQKLIHGTRSRCFWRVINPMSGRAFTGTYFLLLFENNFLY